MQSFSMPAIADALAPRPSSSMQLTSPGVIGRPSNAAAQNFAQSHHEVAAAISHQQTINVVSDDENLLDATIASELVSQTCENAPSEAIISQQQQAHLWSSHKCAVFWDLNNAWIPSGMSGFAAVEHVRSTVHTFGHITLFKAYMKEMDQSLRSHEYNKNIRHELQASGVSLTDSPHIGPKDSLDKMIVVDMLSFAIDSDPSATVVLISHDQALVYALSALRNRRFRIVLIMPNKSYQNVLKHQASVVMDWRYDVLQQKKESQQLSTTGASALTASHTYTPASKCTDRPSSTVSNLPRTVSATLQFDVLVEVLEKEHRNGDIRPLRSRVGVALKQRDPQIYNRGEATTLKDLVELASQAGFVTLGGKAGYAWLALNPDYYNKTVNEKH